MTSVFTYVPGRFIRLPPAGPGETQQDQDRVESTGFKVDRGRDARMRRLRAAAAREAAERRRQEWW